MEPFELRREPNRPALFYLSNWMNAYPEVTAGMTSRSGGVSENELSSLNCALHVQDKTEHVIENRKRVVSELGLPFQAWTCAEQVHGNKIALVTAAERGAGRTSREYAIAATDGLITNSPELLLTAFFADCVPLFFYDPIYHAVGIGHAGWKGTVLNVAEQVVDAMHKAFGSNAGRLLAAVGPSIGICCYEVDDQVMERVFHALPDHEHRLEEGQILYKKLPSGKYRLNLKEINRQFMLKAGILPSHIEITELCTSCNTDLLYSHRKECGKTGRMAAWIGLRKR